MTGFVITPPPNPALAVAGLEQRFPLRRVFCVGRNYAAHAREMGADPNREPPFFFTKPADAVVPASGTLPYPSSTRELHHEVELVVALKGGGTDIAPEQAMDLVWGYGVGLDLTRRDLQATAKAKSLPWDSSKAFDQSAPVSALRTVAEISHPQQAHLALSVNDAMRQQADIAEMIFKVPEIIAELSKLWELAPGDLIFTGTPAGVAALQRGDRFRAELGDIAACEGRIV